MTSKISTFSAALNLLNGSVGVGVLGLPFAFKKSGWVALPILAFCCSATYYTATVIVKVLSASEAAKGKEGRRPVREQSSLNYDYLGVVGFGVKGQMLAGLVQLGELLLAAIAVLLLLADNLVELAGIPHVQALYTAAAVSYALSITKPELLAYFSLLSLAVVVAQVAILSYMAASSLEAAAAAVRTTTLFVDSNGALEALGAMMFCFGGHSMLPSQFALMESPKSAPKLLRRIFLFMGTLYASIGGIGYAVYGDAVKDKFIDNFPSGSVLTSATRVAMAYNLQSTMPIVIAAISSYFVSAADTAASFSKWAWGSFLKLLLVLMLVVLTNAVADRFDLVVSVGGASLVSAVSLIFPLALNMQLNWRLMHFPEKLWNVLLLAASLLFAGDGTRRGLRAKGLL